MSTEDERHPTGDTTKPRDSQGRYARDVTTVERDAQALKLRAQGLRYQDIANELGYTDKSAAHKAVQRGLAETIQAPAAQVRELELARLDAMYEAVMRVLEAKHFTVSQGKVVYLGEEPLEDDAPVLAAVDRLLKIQERRAKLLGLDAPSKQEIGGKLSYEIVGVDLDQL